MKNKFLMKSSLIACSVSAATMTAPILTSCSSKTTTSFINVKHYCDNTGVSDCADTIQNLIDNNPHKTLFFDDGTYLLSHPIKTPGNPAKSVSLQLTDFAILKPTQSYQIKRTVTQSWEDDNNYMVQLGGLDRVNKEKEVGSNYGMYGGIIDGDGRACGIEISGGRETRVQNVSLKNIEIGIRIAPGVNGSGSADANITNISISGNTSSTSKAILVDGMDNVFENIRSYYTHIGAQINRSGNSFVNVQCLCNNLPDDAYPDSIGFDCIDDNHFYRCYSDGYRTGWNIRGWDSLDGKIICDSCIAYWFNKTISKQYSQIAINSQYKMSSLFTNFRVGFIEPTTKDKNVVLNISNESSDKGSGNINNIIIRNRNYLASDDKYKDYLTGNDIDW